MKHAKGPTAPNSRKTGKKHQGPPEQPRRLAEQLADGRLHEWLVATLDHIGLGVLLVDEQGLLLYGNAIARRFLRQNDGLQISKGKIVLPDRDFREQIPQLLRQGAEHGTVQAKLIARSAERRPITLIALPLLNAEQRRRCPDTTTFVMFLLDPERPLNAGAELLGSLYHLTDKECQVLKLMLEGATPQEAAKRLSVHYSTVRTHLLSIFRKTLVRGQSDLIRLALTSLLNVFPNSDKPQ